jgi:hypothetical protein
MLAGRRIFFIFSVILGGVVPLFALHSLRGYGAIGLSPTSVWVAKTFDSVLVSLLATMIASSCYSAYLLGTGFIDD